MKRTPLKRHTSLKRGSSKIKRSRISPVSKKNAARKAIRRDLVARILAARPICEFPDCHEPAVHVHEPHTRGRGGDELDVRNTQALCAAHHRFVHEGDPQKHLVSGSVHATIDPHERRSDMGHALSLSDEHWRVLAWIGDFTMERGFGPTIEEILVGVGDEFAHAILGDLCSRSMLELEPKRIGALRRTAR